MRLLISCEKKEEKQFVKMVNGWTLLKHRNYIQMWETILNSKHCWSLHSFFKIFQIIFLLFNRAIFNIFSCFCLFCFLKARAKTRQRNGKRLFMNELSILKFSRAKKCGELIQECLSFVWSIKVMQKIRETNKVKSSPTVVTSVLIKNLCNDVMACI